MLFEVEPKTLYKKDAKDHIRSWTIFQKQNIIVIQHGVLNGALQTQTEVIQKGKAARTLQQQIESRINSRFQKQLLKGYKTSLEEAIVNRTNTLNFMAPMLAQRLDKVKNVDISKAKVQMKFDGNRCLITNYHGKLIAYSRNGKVIETIDHILEDINIPEGMTIDGELYAHNYTLQEIRSWISRKQVNTYNLKLHVYDLITSEVFSLRYEMLQSFELGDTVEVAATWEMYGEQQIQQKFREAREDGYEGLIIRLDTVGYETGKRSKSLLKMKEWLDEEFKVVNITASADDWAVLECVTKYNTLFAVSAPGTFKERKVPLENPKNFIGTFVRVEFANWTKDKIPFQPTAANWSDNE